MTVASRILARRRERATHRAQCRQFSRSCRTVATQRRTTEHARLWTIAARLWTEAAEDESRVEAAMEWERLAQATLAFAGWWS